MIGLWGDESLYQGAMEADRVAFLADGTGWFEHANAFATEVERFRWEQLPGGQLRLEMTRYLFLQSGKAPESKEHWQSEQLFAAGVGLGTDVFDAEVTILTLQEPGGPPRRFALVRAEVTAAADPAAGFD